MVIDIPLSLSPCLDIHLTSALDGYCGRNNPASGRLWYRNCHMDPSLTASSTLLKLNEGRGYNTTRGLLDRTCPQTFGTCTEHPELPAFNFCHALSYMYQKL